MKIFFKYRTNSSNKTTFQYFLQKETWTTKCKEPIAKRHPNGHQITLHNGKKSQRRRRRQRRVKTHTLVGNRTLSQYSPTISDEIILLSEELLQLHRQRQVVSLQCTTHECIHRNHGVLEHCLKSCTIRLYCTVSTIGASFDTLCYLSDQSPGASTFDDN